MNWHPFTTGKSIFRSMESRSATILNLFNQYYSMIQAATVAIVGLVLDLFGYQPCNETRQQVILPMYYFAPANPELDSFKFTLVGSWLNNFYLWFDNIQFQHSTGTFRSDAKQLQITVNQDGKVIEAVEIAVPEWLDFTFADIATKGEGYYTLNLKARVDYVIESLVLNTN